jgi:hypothetical protein
MTKANIGAKYDYRNQNMTSGQIPLVIFGWFCCSGRSLGFIGFSILLAIFLCAQHCMCAYPVSSVVNIFSSSIH